MLMNKQVLIYETAVPLTHERHGQWSVEVGDDYRFSGEVNSVPLMTVEFSRAAGEYPIVLSGADGSVVPVVVLGMRGNENLYVNKQGSWQAKYIPAFIRRYPFVFSSSEDGSTLTLCIDEAFAGFNQEGRGEKLFDDQGKPTTYVQKVLNFLQGYQTEFQRTQVFGRKLQDLNVLEAMQAEVTTDSGQFLSLTGFSSISRSKLKELSGDTLANMAKNDELELAHLQLYSLQNFDAMKERLATSSTGTALLKKNGKGNGDE